MNTFQAEFHDPHDDFTPLTDGQREGLHSVGWNGNMMLRNALEDLKKHEFMEALFLARAEILLALEGCTERERYLQMPLSEDGVSKLLGSGILTPRIFEDVMAGLEEVRAHITAFVTVNYFRDCLSPFYDQLKKDGKEVDIPRIDKEVLSAIHAYLACLSPQELKNFTTIQHHIDALWEAQEDFQGSLQAGKLAHFSSFEKEYLPKVLEALIEELIRRKDEDKVYGIALDKEGKSVSVYADEDGPGDLALAGPGETTDDEHYLDIPWMPEDEFFAIADVSAYGNGEVVIRGDEDFLYRDSPAAPEILDQAADEGARLRREILKSLAANNLPAVLAVKSRKVMETILAGVEAGVREAERDALRRIVSEETGGIFDDEEPVVVVD